MSRGESGKIFYIGKGAKPSRFALRCCNDGTNPGDFESVSLRRWAKHRAQGLNPWARCLAQRRIRTVFLSKIALPIHPFHNFNCRQRYLKFMHKELHTNLSALFLWSSRLPRDTSFTWFDLRLVFVDNISGDGDANRRSGLSLFANGVRFPCIGLASCVLPVGG